jgi:hypothetical protein
MVQDIDATIAVECVPRGRGIIVDVGTHDG